MKKVLLIHTLYRNFGGEDSAVESEIQLLKSKYKVDKLLFDNSKKINFYDLINFLFLTNIESNKKLAKKTGNKLTQNVIKYFMDMFRHYLNWNKVKEYNLHLNSIWVNQMKEHEYNPVHIHRGTLFTGLSSVMILSLPSTYGKEYSNEEIPQNGKLQILGSASGQFAKIDYQPNLKVRDFLYNMLKEEILNY